MKSFVIDTNVLLHDPRSILKFNDNRVVIPMTVLEELDSMKRAPSELGRNAREAIRLLTSLKTIGEGDLHSGVKLKNNSIVLIDLAEATKSSAQEAGFNLDVGISDNKILYCAFIRHKIGETVIFVSKDFAARLKAEAIGIDSEDYKKLTYSFDAIYKGIKNVEVEKSQIDNFLKDGVLRFENLKAANNEYIFMQADENSSAVGKWNLDKKEVQQLIKEHDIWGIKARNDEQKCAIDLLLREEINLVTLVGPAGTGKTLLALACGLKKVFDEGAYSRILVSRPIVPLGRDIGYLPGTKEEKLFHWMQPIYDNLEFLCAFSGDSDSRETMQWVMESKKIEMEAMTYIRGRSLPKMYLIIDEAQNLTPHEIKTIISRAGDGTKVILAGDPSQIDNPYLDKDSNGLTYAVGKFHNHKLYGHIYLDKTERSALAALAAEVL